MSRLFKFEIKRMKYKKIHIILPLIIISRLNRHIGDLLI